MHETPMANLPQLTFDKVIRLSKDNQIIWEIPLEALLIVGEATNAGPRDHSYCFVDDAGTWLDAPVNSIGAVDAMTSLSKVLGVNLLFTLGTSDPFKSRVIWPDDLAGKPMFAYNITPAKGLLGKLMGTKNIEQRLADDIADFIDHAAADDLVIDAELEPDDEDDDEPPKK